MKESLQEKLNNRSLQLDLSALHRKDSFVFVLQVTAPFLNTFLKTGQQLFWFSEVNWAHFLNFFIFIFSELRLEVSDVSTMSFIPLSILE